MRGLLKVQMCLNHFGTKFTNKPWFIMLEFETHKPGVGGSIPPPATIFY